MEDYSLNAEEKSRLTDYAQKIVDRGARARAASQASNGRTDEATDVPAVDNVGARLAVVEKELDELRRHVEKTLASILATVKRLEARSFATSGEVHGLREALDERCGDIAYAQNELVAAAKDYGVTLNAEITRLNERLDTSDVTVADPAARRDGAGHG